MLKKTMTYVDFDGNPRTEDFRFNLTKAELAEMQMSESGGLEQMLNNIVSAQDIPKMAAAFKELILKSYGVKSPDGKRFIKNAQIREEFEQTQAYSDLYMLLATDDKEALNFIRGIIPADLNDKLDTNALPIR